MASGVGARAFCVILALIATITLGPPAAGASSGSTFVRVDQLGYAAMTPKRAYVMSRREETGAPYSLLREGDGTPVAQGVLGASLGSWSKRFGHVYAIDFDAVQAPGTYTIELGGKAPASSPAFAIMPAASLYEQPLANALHFYETERDGPEYIPSPLRTAPAHLNDEHAITYETPKVNGAGEFKGELKSLGQTIDASGGWWDAGDYLKFVQTASYTVDLMLTGVRDFPAEMGASAGASNFTDEARFGVEWLLRMWNDSTRTLYYQVGIGEGNAKTLGDHDIWRLPQADDTYGGEDSEARYIRHRPVFRAGPPGSPVSPNLAGRDAAAFALCFQVFAATLPSLADRCLKSSEDIFELADTDPSDNLLTTIPYDFYPETEWRDDLELGASELAIALSAGEPLPSGLTHIEPSYYLKLAAQWASAYIAHSGAGETLNLYDVSGLANFELVRELRAAGEPSGLAVSEAQLINELGAQLDQAGAQAERDPFGFGFPWDEADTVSHGDGLSVMASEYDYLVGAPDYAADAVRWLGNVLGANAWGSSFIIGDGSTFPDCPSDQIANLLGSLDGTSPVLAGGVVEGPSEGASSGKLSGMRNCPSSGNAYKRFNSKAVFEDNVQSYTTSEPAIDLTASSPLAFSWQVASVAPLPR
jgi:endoglucanase